MQMVPPSAAKLVERCAKMAKQNARLTKPSDATVEGGMAMGVNVGKQKTLSKPMKMRGGGAATKGVKISEKQG